MMLFVHWSTVVAGVLSVAGVAITAIERNRLRRRLSGGADEATEPSPRVADAQAKKPGKRRRGRSGLHPVEGEGARRLE